ncbi:MAG: tetraacyldisaccharide 4'-kinase, partial [Fibrobacteraceae bacterium]|nr:tetraacyldisaccharide 4'-kinase [Fibrobacteraceae bacterium]
MIRFLKYVTSFLYRACYVLSQRLFFKKGQSLQASKVIVVGSYLAGGAGKTPFSLALAGRFIAKGLHIAVLCHKEAWDEFLLFKEYGVPAFCTANRYKTAHEIDGSYDFIICDGGLEDSRFVNAAVLILRWNEPASKIPDLIPYGKCISLEKDHKDAYNVMCGAEETGKDLCFCILQISNNMGKQLPSRKAILMTSIGDPLRFKRDAENRGWTFCETIFLKDHSRNFAAEVKKSIGKNLPILMTEKDFVKLDSLQKKNPLIFVAKERVVFSKAFEKALKKL